MKSKIIYAALVGAALLPNQGAQAAELQVLIPWYNYPNHWVPESYLWDDLAASASQVPITAIVNPANGPGVGGPNADYLVGMAELASGGVTNKRWELALDLGAFALLDARGGVVNRGTLLDDVEHLVGFCGLR